MIDLWSLAIILLLAIPGTLLLVFARDVAAFLAEAARGKPSPDARKVWSVGMVLLAYAGLVVLGASGLFDRPPPPEPDPAIVTPLRLDMQARWREFLANDWVRDTWPDTPEPLADERLLRYRSLDRTELREVRFFPTSAPARRQLTARKEWDGRLRYQVLTRRGWIQHDCASRAVLQAQYGWTVDVPDSRRC